MKLLLARSANINAVNNDADLPLMLAVTFSHLEILKLLLANGADVHLACCTGATPVLLWRKGGMRR